MKQLKPIIMLTKEEILEKQGFDFEQFQLENEYSGKAILNAMEEFASQDKWISIHERDKKLPDGDFLVLFDNGEVRRYFEDNHPFTIYTHWQLLPNPPKNL